MQPYPSSRDTIPKATLDVETLRIQH